MHTELVPAAIGIIFTFAVFGVGFTAGDWYASRKRDTAKPLSESAEAAARKRGSKSWSESDRDIDRRNRNYLTRDEIHAAKKAVARG
jgi:hypothetical protein